MKKLITIKAPGMHAIGLNFLIFFLLSINLCYAQNVGIGVENPTEKLQVDGIVHSVIDGFRFPDGTVQSTASTSFEPHQAGDNRWIMILRCVTPSIEGSFNFDTIQNAIKVISYQWGMSSVPAGGQSEFTINKVIIIKNIDVSTNPLLFHALIAAVMGELRLYFFREQEGGMQLYYKVHLYNVVIRAFDQEMVFKGGEEFAHLDIIAFEFDEATWYYDDGENMNEVDWPAP